jgi:haloacetate dehalogenase
MLIAARREPLEDGRAIAVARLGGFSGPPVVLLHGYPDTTAIWSRVAPLLARGRSVIAFDWPGLGGSDAWPGGTTPWHQAERLRALLDRWRIPAAHLVAMDMGAQPALVLASEDGARVRSLTVMNALVDPGGATSWDIRVLRRMGWNRWLLCARPGLVFRRAAASSSPAFARGDGELLDALWRSFRALRVRRFITRLCAGYQGTLPRLGEACARIRCPTLLLWGGRDRHFPLAQAAAARRAINGAELVVLPHGRHWMAWHRPWEVADAIERFLARHD